MSQAVPFRAGWTSRSESAIAVPMVFAFAPNSPIAASRGQRKRTSNVARPKIFRPSDFARDQYDAGAGFRVQRLDPAAELDVGTFVGRHDRRVRTAAPRSG